MILNLTKEEHHNRETFYRDEAQADPLADRLPLTANGSGQNRCKSVTRGQGPHCILSGLALSDFCLKEGESREEQEGQEGSEAE
jgi:hypothetical protein